MKTISPDELPVAANQKEIEKRIREMLGPPPQEASSTTEPPATEKPVVEEVPPPATPPPSAPIIEGKPIPTEPVTPKTEADKIIVSDNIPEDETTAEAVDDIVAKEGDQVLAAEDAELSKAFTPEKSDLASKLKKFFSNWWGNPLARKATIAGLVIAIVAAAVVPNSRYFLLNTAGARAAASLTVIDEANQQPLKNIPVTLAGQTGVTDSDGKAHLSKLKLGKSELVVGRKAYTIIRKQITVGWGSNPLGSFSLKAVGSQYTIIVRDYLSGKPIEKAEANNEEASAGADKDGNILLAVEGGSDKEVTVTISAKSYRDEKLTFNLDSKQKQQVSMVPDRKSVFVSKRSGKYDVYKVDIDGKNEEVVLKGTGTEQDNMALMSHPTDEVAAFVSTRENTHSSEGYLLSTLSLIDVNSNSYKNIGQSERIQLIGWIGSRIIYVQIAAGTSAANPQRYRLIAYDYKTSEKRELASANNFNDVLTIGNVVYYAVGNTYQPSGITGFVKINADNTGKQTILSQEVWTLYRLAYDNLAIPVGTDWYDYKLGNSTATKLATAPANPKSRTYVDSPDKSHSLWVDQRDGKGVLLAYDTITKADKILKTQSGLADQVRWLNNSTLIYRIHTDQETADYAINIDGGDAKKVKDVTDVVSIEQGYFY